MQSLGGSQLGLDQNDDASHYTERKSDSDDLRHQYLRLYRDETRLCYRVNEGSSADSCELRNAPHQIGGHCGGDNLWGHAGSGAITFDPQVLEIALSLQSVCTGLASNILLN